MLSQKTLDFPIPALIGGLLLIGIFLLFFGLWYEIPGNAWDYLGVTANIHLASVFTLLVARLLLASRKCDRRNGSNFSWSNCSSYISYREREND
jgi:hypothetical protein